MFGTVKCVTLNQHHSHFVQHRCLCLRSPPPSTRSVACWCSEGPMSTTARRCWATPRCCASSVTSATRRSPPCCWSSALALTWCPKTAWAPCASRPPRDTWDSSCCSASEGPRWGGALLRPVGLIKRDCDTGSNYRDVLAALVALQKKYICGKVACILASFKTQDSRFSPLFAACLKNMWASCWRLFSVVASTYLAQMSK